MNSMPRRREWRKGESDDASSHWYEVLIQVNLNQESHPVCTLEEMLLIPFQRRIRMASRSRHNRSRRSNAKSSHRTNKPNKRLTLQKPNGSLARRVQDVGPQHFAIVCVDPAKLRSEWMMADFLGNMIIPPTTLEHQLAGYQAAMLRLRNAIRENGIKDVVVVLERTGRFHHAPRAAFRQAGFETRIIHPFATKQFRLPDNPGVKTDPNDLCGMHRASVAGFGLIEPEPDPTHRRLQMLARHRRDLVQKASRLCCQIRDHLHVALPGYAGLFQDLWTHQSALVIPRIAATPQAVLELGADRLRERLQADKLRPQTATIAKVMAWAAETVRLEPDPDTEFHNRVWIDLDDHRQMLRQCVFSLERDIASTLAGTPYVRLLCIPGINVVSAGELGGELGLIRNYAGPNSLTGRCGLYPGRYQSDGTDRTGGIIRSRNRPLRAALMRIADNLANHNRFFRGQAELARSRGEDERKLRIPIAKRFTRLAFALVAGDEPLRHPCCQSPDAVLEKLREFQRQHQTSPEQVLLDLQTAIDQLTPGSHPHEATVLTQVLEQQSRRRRGPTPLGALLPAVLSRLTSGGGMAQQPSQPTKQPANQQESLHSRDVDAGESDQSSGSVAGSALSPRHPESQATRTTRFRAPD